MPTLNPFTRIRLAKALVTIGICSLLGTPALAGQFKRSLGRGDSLKVKAPALPSVRIGRTTLAIDVKDATNGANANATEGIVSVPATQLQSAIDLAFRESFTLVQSNGEASLRVAVTHYTPADSTIVSTIQKTRIPSVDAETRRRVMVEKEIAIEQWTAKGQLALRVEIVDSSGVLLDAFAPQARVQASEIISYDGVDRVDRTQLPTKEMVLTKLINDLVVQFVPRYCPPSVEVEIPLAVDEELRDGNQLAKTGDLAGAAKNWEAVSIAKVENAGDKIHNIGAAYEAQGINHLMKQVEGAKVRPYLQQAAKYYADAAMRDPDEKYIFRAGERIRKAFGLVEAIEALERTRQKALNAKAPPSPWPPGAAVVSNANQDQPGVQTSSNPLSQVVPADNSAPSSAGKSTTIEAALDPATQEALAKALEDERPDNQQEGIFRQYVKLRLRSTPNAVDETATRQIETAGSLAHGLSALAAKRVIHQEAASWAAVQPKIAVYRDAFDAFAQDGRITAEERAALRIMVRKLALPEAEVKAIEAGKKVVE